MIRVKILIIVRIKLKTLNYKLYYAIMLLLC